MNRRSIALLVAVAGAARAEEDATPLDAKRDELIDKIARGVDGEASVRAFAALLGERDKAAAPEELRRITEAENRAWRQAYQKTADAFVGGICRLPPDPAHPNYSDDAMLLADWGRITRREEVRRAPKNALDEGEKLLLYELKGARALYRFRGDRAAMPGHTFEAQPGDLVLFCASTERHSPDDNGLPESWRGISSFGRAIKIKQPPKIVSKTKWDPIQVKDVDFFWAIKDVRWKHPPDRYVLAHVEVLRDTGDGAFDISAGSAGAWRLEVPPTVKRRELLVPGHIAWVIAGQPRFDARLKRFVLVAADIEARYIEE